MRHKAEKELITLKLLIMLPACLMYSVKKFLSDENSGCWTSPTLILKDLHSVVLQLVFLGF